MCLKHAIWTDKLTGFFFSHIVDEQLKLNLGEKNNTNNNSVKTKTTKKNP